VREYLVEDLVAYFDDVDLDLRARGGAGPPATSRPPSVTTHGRGPHGAAGVGSAS
jgi:hypothetical protein